ncbi:MAG: DUF2341 domain-containing protein, partial [Methanomicrobiales archaeon]
MNPSGQRRPVGEKPAISEIVGTIALIAVVVIGIVIINVVIISSPSRARIPSVEATMANQSTLITIAHQGGDPIPWGQFKILVDGVDRTASFNNSGPYPWSIGQTLSYNASTLPSSAVVIYKGTGGDEVVILETKFPWGMALSSQGGGLGSVTKLTLIKTVVNDNGGTRQVSEFPLFIDGAQVISGVPNLVSANTEHTVSENSQSGYTSTGWSGNCSSDGKITLATSEDKTCFITNDDTLLVSWFNCSWAYRKNITIDHTKVQGAHTDFPVLISLDAGSSGLNGKAQASGNDILFTLDNGLTKIPHEIERYSAGTLVAWVRVPSVNSTVNTTIMMYYGNPGATNQQNPTTVWTNGYKGVWHLNNSFADSTTSHYDGTNYGTTDIAGQIGYGRAFDGGTQYITTPSTDLKTATDFTISTWFKSSNTAFAHHLIWEGLSSANGWGESWYEQEMHISLGEFVNPNQVSNKISFFYGDNDIGRDTGDIGINQTFSDTSGWHLVEAVVTGAGGSSPGATLYLDGSPIGSDTGTQARTGRASWDTSLQFGKPGASTRYFQGNLDEVHIATTARSSNWIATEYANQNSPSSFYFVGSEVGSPCVGGGAQARLTLVKTVVNNNGGTKQVSDFPLFINSTPATSGVSYSVPANLELTASETSQNGYGSSGWSGNCSSAGKITLAPGEDKTCFIINDDIPTASWYNCGWPYRKNITIDHTKVTGSHNNFPVLVKLDAGTSGLNGKAQANGNDILFTKDDGTTKIPHEIEYYSSGTLVAWVNVSPVTSAADTTIMMYYGNSSVGSQQSVANVWDGNYKAVWHLKENPSGTAPQMKDSTGTANHGTSAGSMTSGDQVAGQIDGSLDFDGSDDYVQGPDYDITGAITVSAWINWDAVTADDGIVSKRTSSEVAGDWALRMDPSGTGTLEWMIWSGVDNSNNVFSNSAVGAGAWKYVVVTFDDPTNTAKIYINGGLDKTDSTTITNSLANTPEQIAIGWAGQGSQYFDGRIDEVRLSNNVRSAPWITTEYANQNSPSTFLSVGGEVASPCSGSGQFIPNPAWNNCYWPYRKAITIDHTKVSGTQSGFPVLINLSSDSDLALHAMANGYDILFTDASSPPNPLPYERELYKSSYGGLVAWVKVPQIQSGSDTTLYMYYGNPSSTDQQNKNAVWDSNFAAAWHLNEAVTAETTGGNHYDSTTNANTGVQYYNGAITGRMGGAQYFNGGDGSVDWIDVSTPGGSSLLSPTSQLTMEAWVYLPTNPNPNYIEKILSLGDGWSKGYTLGVQNSPYGIYPEIWNGSSGSCWLTSGSFNLNTWTHLATTWNQSSNLMIGYINGGQVGSTNCGPNPINTTGLPQLRIG